MEHANLALLSLEAYPCVGLNLGSPSERNCIALVNMGPLKKYYTSAKLIFISGVTLIAKVPGATPDRIYFKSHPFK
jgi:hypothetical protein